MLYKLLCTLLLTFCAASMPLAGDAAGITQYPKLVEADYWTAQNKDGDKLLLDAKGVQSVIFTPRATRARRFSDTLSQN